MKLIYESAQELGDLVTGKALEQVRIQAQARARDFLCDDCLDQRCRTGSLCKAFLTLTDSFAWEMVAEKAELN